tara:strand:+ start:973 stop:1695 length:723 start_codon:yes stop_codon:yes gene_type:complete
MRAFFLDNLDESCINKELIIDGDSFKHIKVVRLKTNEVVMLLNGRGTKVLAKLVDMDKKNATFFVEKLQPPSPKPIWDLAIGLVKKDAFDLCLKMATELGVGTIYPLLTEYSQRYELNMQRAERLVVQALEQSNSSWMPEISQPIVIDDFINKNVDNNKNYSRLICMGMTSKETASSMSSVSGRTLGFIGPEGGFSPVEEEKLATLSSACSIHLPTPILRAPTALAALAGVIFTKQNLLD